MPSIGERIIAWYEKQGRELPWRETRDPYRIWIAEVILQQTRIEQGIKYFYRFMERFPSVQDLAAAPQDQVLKAWEGLGYYSRARNLHAAAKQLVGPYQGLFPQHYSELLNLKGVGPYTARAIGSFAFDNATGVIDGNVLRVMSRVLGDASPINEQKTRKAFQQIVDEWVADVPSRIFNFGMMDIGSTICTPTKPACLICPLQVVCEAYEKGLTTTLPYKSKKLKRKTRFFHFYMLEDEAGNFVVRKRPAQGLWGGLWEIPNEETDLQHWQDQQAVYGGSYQLGLKHVFTHFDMMLQVYRLPLAKAPEHFEGELIPQEEIDTYAFSKAVLKIFDRIF
ncbi:MAG: A/G-specific adenine glycosylase [Bacteroidota bacterium]